MKRKELLNPQARRRASGELRGALLDHGLHFPVVAHGTRDCQKAFEGIYQKGQINVHIITLLIWIAFLIGPIGKGMAAELRSLQKSSLE